MLKYSPCNKAELQKQSQTGMVVAGPTVAGEGCNRRMGPQKLDPIGFFVEELQLEDPYHEGKIVAEELEQLKDGVAVAAASCVSVAAVELTISVCQHANHSGSDSCCNHEQVCYETHPITQTF